MWVLWCYLKLFEFIWGKLDLSGSYLGLSGLSGALHNLWNSLWLWTLWVSLGLSGYSKLSGSILACLSHPELSRAIWAYGATWSYQGQLGAIWAHLRQSGANCYYLGLSGIILG